MDEKAPRLHVPARDVTLDPAPPAPKPREPQVVDMTRALVIPGVHQLLTDAQAILGNELTRLRAASKLQAGLSEAQTLQFARYVRSLVDLAQEEREQQQLDDISRLSDEELLALLLQSDDIIDRVRRVLQARPPAVEETKEQP